MNTASPNLQEREVNSSNSTANLFLHGPGGGRGVRRSWMSPNASVAASPMRVPTVQHAPPHVQSASPRPTEQMRGINHCPPALLDSNVIGPRDENDDEDIFVRNQLHDTALPTSNTATAAGSTALPSPAPSTSLPSPAGELNKQGSCVQTQVEGGQAQASPVVSQTQGQTEAQAQQNSPPDALVQAKVKIDDVFWYNALTTVTNVLKEPPTAGFDIPLVHVLCSACTQKDLYYLAFYQVYCVSKHDPAAFATMSVFAGKPAQALRVVDQLLLPNRQMTDEFLSWSLRFPFPLKTMMTSHRYRSAMKEVSYGLQLLHDRWAPYETHVRARGYPPLADEIAMTFAIVSPVVMHIIFVALSSHLYTPATEPRFRELFAQNRHAFVNRFFADAHAPLEAMRRETSQLIMAYLSLNPGVDRIRLETVIVPWFGGGVDPLNPGLRAGQTPMQIGIPGQSGVPIAISVPVQSQAGTPVQMNAPQMNAQSSPQSYITPYPSAQDEPSRAQTVVVTGNSGVVATAVDGNGAMPNPNMPLAVGGPQAPRPTPGQQGQGRARAPALSTNLLPPPGTNPVTTVRPNPLRVALHQAHLRDPQVFLFRKNQDGTALEASSLVQYLNSFKVDPIPLGFVECAFNFEFSLEDADLQKLTGLFAREEGQRPMKIAAEGDHIYRLRCIRTTPGVALNKHIWNATDTTWPSVVYIFVNNTELFVRRKFHNGKDLPLDITNHLRQGVNKITVHVLRNAAESQTVHYAMAVEIMELSTEHHARRLCRVHLADRSRARLHRRLQARTQHDDEDLTIVNDDLTIDLVDPFTARIWDLPARSTQCAHPECFDQHTFIHTRSNLATFVGPLKDNWKCPICSSDASPQNLIIDAFLVEVREEISKSGRLDAARALRFRADGSWEVKFAEPEASAAGPGPGPGSGSGSATPTVPSKRKHDDMGDSPDLAKTASTPGSASNPPVIELD